MKVPPANELNATSIKTVPASYKIRPSMIPHGVASANMTRRNIPFFFSSLSTKFLVIELPSDIAAGILWQRRASMMFRVAEKSLVSPKAIPSNTACIDSASTNTRLDRPKPAHIPLVSL